MQGILAGTWIHPPLTHTHTQYTDTLLLQMQVTQTNFHPDFSSCYEKIAMRRLELSDLKCICHQKKKNYM